MTFTIDGEYNTATVHGDRYMFGESCIDQIKEMVDSPAFEGDNSVAIMSDAHWGSGAVIGFTMSIKNKIVPDTIGVDIGCGMYAANFANIPELDLEKLDSEIRDRVPTGFNTHNNQDYHMLEDFPWHECKQDLKEFDESIDFIDFLDVDEVYNSLYFEELCQKVGYDMTRAINSIGTLGGNNHFIEVGRDNDNNLWTIIHSGSRGIGASIAQYWQNRATDAMNKRAMEVDIPPNIAPYINESWKPRTEKIREDFEGQDIQDTFDKISQLIQETKESEQHRNTDLDYLEGDEIEGYVIDMIFAQKYASESRKLMMQAVADSLDQCMYESDDLHSTPRRVDQIESVHNYIDFNDQTIRKGACRAQRGEKIVVPFNMSYGTIIAEGKGKESWNKSSAHGAGRAMSRTAARQKFDQADFDDQTKGVYMSEMPLDECPKSYKDPESVEQALGENIEVERRVKPILSIKAE